MGGLHRSVDVNSFNNFNGNGFFFFFSCHVCVFFLFSFLPLRFVHNFFVVGQLWLRSQSLQKSVLGSAHCANKSRWRRCTVMYCSDLEVTQDCHGASHTNNL